MAAAVDEAIAMCDLAISEVENMVPAEQRPPLETDPDDPWQLKGGAAVRKERCAKTGYLMTRPFERACPMPAAFDGDASFLDGMLKPVRQLSNKQTAAAAAAAAPAAAAGKDGGDAKKKKQPAAAAKEGGGGASGSGAPLESFGKCWLCVGRVVSVDCVEGSDKLYCCQVETAGGEDKGVRQVITGLQKYVPVDGLLGKHVVLIMNLKVAKLAGMKSEAMILCGEAAAGADKAVWLLAPPPGSEAGERVYLEGGAPSDAFPKQLKSKVWDEVKPLLRVAGGAAAYAADDAGATPLVTAGGKVTVAGCPDGSSIL